MDNVISKKRERLAGLKALRPERVKESAASAPEGLFVKCLGCGAGQPRAVMKESLYVCPKCGHHNKISAARRLRELFDDGKYREIFKKKLFVNPIGFPDYKLKLEQQYAKSGLSEAAVCAEGLVGGVNSVGVVLDSNFLMGSMGSVVGERIAQSIEYAQKGKKPLVIFSASGGARMQEGIFSLMQMAKTSAALKRFSDAGGFFLSYLTHPTTGGVTASFASLGDIILAEPGALVGFAGPRVIEQTIHQKLPDGFQRAEFLMEHGFVDNIVERKDMKKMIARLIKLHRRLRR